MNNPVRVGVKFCGNCNPQVFGGELFRQVIRSIECAADIEFVTLDSRDMEVMLIINGCPAACADRPKGDYAEIVVTPESVNFEQCRKEEVGGEVVKHLRGLMRE